MTENEPDTIREGVTGINNGFTLIEKESDKRGEKCPHCRYEVAKRYSVRNDDINICGKCLAELMDDEGDIVLPGSDAEAIMQRAGEMEGEAEKAELLDQIVADIAEATRSAEN